MNRIYLDHAASTPLDPEVLDAMLPYLRGEFGNASSVHGFGQRARGAIDEARVQVAALIGARDSEIVFTGSGTEADNLAIIGVMHGRSGDGRRNVVVSAIEHHAILNTVKALDRGQPQVTRVAGDESGRIDLARLTEAVDDQTALVSVMLANNETGVIQNVPEVARIAKAKGALVHTDAVQALGKFPLDVNRLGVDLMTLSAHKIYGPKGAGVLYVRSGTRMSALVRGGAQERNRRAGTENVAAIAGFGKAAELADARMAGDMIRIALLRDRLESALIDGTDITVRRNGLATDRIASTSNLSFLGVSGEDLLVALDLEGIAVSTGAACAAGSPEPSHVLKAMGLARERVNSSIRFSLGRSTTAEEIDRAVAIVKAAVARLRRTPLERKHR